MSEALSVFPLPFSFRPGFAPPVPGFVWALMGDNVVEPRLVHLVLDQRKLLVEWTPVFVVSPFHCTSLRITFFE